MMRLRLLAILGILLHAEVCRAGTLAQFRTTVGDFDVELFDADKPVTVANFIRYIRTGLYTNMIMHRVVTNFVIQGGGIYVANRNTPSNVLAHVPTFPPITNEFKVGKFYSNVYGTIAMAKTSDPNSATSQFFFNLANNSASLDNTNNSGGFTVFGRVVGGTNILNRFKIGPTNTVVKQVNLGSVSGELTECPVRYAATSITYNDLIYVDISLLNVQVTPKTNGTREVSWNSASNRVNYLEYATSLPPSWQPLFSTNGNGSVIKFSDSSTTNQSRFYRVRVVY